MTHAVLFRKDVRLLCAAGGAVLVVCAALPLSAQRPVFRSAATRASMHPVAAQLDPAAGAPDPPSPGQNNSPEIREDLFTGTEKFAKGASDVTEVTMDPSSLDLVNGTDAHRAHRTVLNVVRTYTYDKPGMYNPADVEEYRHKLETGDWHCSVHVRDLKSGESTDVCSKRRAPDMVESAIITVGPKSLTFIHTIRKANGQGGSLDTRSFPGLGEVLMPPMAFSGPRLTAEMQAEILASTATVRAELPELLRDAHNTELEMSTQRQRMAEQMKSFNLQLKPELAEQLKHLQEQLQQDGLGRPVRP